MTPSAGAEIHRTCDAAKLGVRREHLVIGPRFFLIASPARPVECERLEARAVAGEVIDLDLFGTLTDRLGRAFQRLGLKRVPRDVTPTLAEYLARKANAAEANESST